MTLSVDQFREQATKIETQVGSVIVGQNHVVRHVLVSILAGGHVLLEGVPGLGKTMLIRTLGEVLDLKFSRIQFTPDLMPADILGTEILSDSNGQREFRFRQGPLFANLVLADEINRATPKTQSALLEAMQEGSVTVAQQTYKLAEPFFVMATQNPLEMEGTYPLPEAQLDRFFFKVNVNLPSANELVEIMDRTTGKDSRQRFPIRKQSRDRSRDRRNARTRARCADCFTRQRIYRAARACHPPRRSKRITACEKICALWSLTAWRTSCRIGS